MNRWQIVRAPFGYFLFPKGGQHWPVVAEFSATAEQARRVWGFIREEAR